MRTITVRQIFQARTRMLDFGENVCGGRQSVDCPFGCPELDNQEHAFSCQVIRQKLDVVRNYGELFKDNIPMKKCVTLTNIMKESTELLHEKNLE